MKRILPIPLVIVILLVSCKSSCDNSNEGLTVVIGAFNEEIEYLEAQMENGQEVIIDGLRFMKGTISDKPVIIGISGIGKVNAAMTTTLVIHHFQPDQLIFTGIAGGLNPEIRPGDLVVAKQTVQHDLLFIGKDTSISYIPRNPINNEDNPIYYSMDSTLFNCAIKASVSTKFLDIPGKEGNKPKVISGTIATGDAFIASKIKKEEIITKFKADAVEMEGAAVAQVCYQLGVPCIIIRSISDDADDNAKVTLEQFYKVAAINSATLVVNILAEI